MKTPVAVVLYSVLFGLSCVIHANGQLPIQMAQTGIGGGGTYSLPSMGGGPIDALNLGNLNAHITIPVLQKAGRGAPYSYNLTYDSSVWYPVSTSNTKTWMHQANYGWNFAVPNYTAHIIVTYGNVTSQTVQTWTQPCDPSHNNWNPITVSVYSFYKYYDSTGNPHPFNLSTSNYGGGCAGVSAPPETGTAVAADGSGYTLNVTTSGPIVTSSDGKVINLIQTYTSAILTTDKNGNYISETANGSSEAITDTLGQTVLTIAGTNPVTLTYTAPSGGSPQYKINYSSYSVKTNFGCSGIGEFTASGVSLISSISLPDGTSYQFSYEPTPNNAGYTTARLTQVTLPTGGSISYTYTGANDGAVCADGSTLGLTRVISPGGAWTYARSNVSGNQWTTTITTPPDPANSGSASDVTVINFSHDNNSYVNAPGFFETERQVYQGSNSPGNLLMTTMKCYNGNFANCVSAQVTTPITQSDTYSIFPNNTASLSDVHYNTYGLVSEDKEYGYGVGTGSAPSAAFLLRDTVTTYASLSNGIVDKPASVIVKDGSSPQNVLSETTYAYDEYSVQVTSTPNHQSVTGSRGNVTTISRAISWNPSAQAVSGWLTQHFNYYDTGNVNQSQDVNGQWTTYNYDTTPQGNSTKSCGNSFVTSVTYPLTGPTGSNATVWNCIGGVAAQVTDANGNSSTTSFSDPYYWRAASTQDPALNTTTFGYTPAGPSTPATIESRMLFNGGSSIVEQLTTLDGFGRSVIRQNQEGPASGNYDSTQVIYDALGRAYQSTMPCVVAAGIGCGSAAKATATVDALGRSTQVSDGGSGYVNYSYTQNDVLQLAGPAPAGENAKQKQLEYDALGRLTSVCELTSTLSGYGSCGQINSHNGYWTTYTYDTTTINSLLYIRVTVKQNVQAASGSQQTRIYLYDLIGRLVSEQNPETNGLAVSYTYDSASGCSGAYSGDLVKMVDAKGNTVCYQYDALHRATQISYPSGPDSGNTPTKTFVYDSATYNGSAMLNAEGQMAEAYTGPVGSKATDEFFGYSSRGELTDIWECTPHSGGGNGCASVSNYYHVNAGFWANGALQTLSTNISGIPVQTYGVDAMGRTASVSASSGQNPVTGTSYNLATSVYSVTFGSGDSDEFDMDPNTGRMKNYIFHVGSGTDTGTLTWNSNGSLASLAISDTVSGTADTQTCNYTHDDLARIASVNCANGGVNQWNQNFTYDSFGNITKTVPVGGTGTSFQPTYSTATNWLTSLPGATPTYDNNGQLTYDGVHSYAWDVEGKMINVDTTTLTHDALGRLVEKNVNGTYTQIVYGPARNKFATVNGQTLQKAFIPLPAAVAVYTSSGLAYYRHNDHLGSSRMTTTPSRTMYSSTAYAPYGEAYTQTGSIDLSFTGQNQDTQTGLYDFMYRKYNPAHGRWTSPDPAGLASADLTTPQSWNRYAYVMNSPMNIIDPLGLDCVWDDGSYDASDDFDNNPDACAALGGTYMSSVMGDYNPNPDDELAFQAHDMQEGYVSSVVFGAADSYVYTMSAYNMLKVQPNGPTAYVTADHRNILEKMGDAVNNALNNWADKHSHALEVFSCFAAPDAVTEINQTAAQMHGQPTAPQTDDSNGAGQNYIWVNATQMPNAGSNKNGPDHNRGFGPVADSAGVTKTGGLAAGLGYANSVGGCLHSQ